ncbi:MAG: hypothetical protein JWN24_3422 [Phycisphaerales bacterium]|nr:hypothetical protein [Phycisphaerales bacterium]
MDLSKLPRLSKTETPPAPPPTPQPQPEKPESAVPYAPVTRGDTDAVGIGAEVWFMTIIGIVLILFGHSFIKYELSRLTHTPYHTGTNWTSGPKEGEEVAYPDLADMTGIAGGAFWTDSSVCFLGIAMILDAAARGLATMRVPGGRGLLRITLGITVFVVFYNFYVCAKIFSGGALPIISALAIAFGGYLAFFQWATLQDRRAVDRGRA